MRWLAALLFCSGVAVAQNDTPDWVRKAKPADSTYKYYVGRSSNSSSEQAGISDATREAYEQAIRENFGFQTRIQADSYETTKKSVATKRVQVLSQDIRVFGFEQMEFFSKARGDRFDVWVLYRYPLAEISREKSRLLGLKKDAVEFSEQGSSQSAQTSGILEITTEPAGATVIVDGQTYGISPMRLKGVVDAGRHKIQLDHKGFETVEETAVLVPGKTSKITKTLVPAMAKVAITTEPSNATVMLNGQPLGTTPISDLEVPANKPMKLEITHAEANPFSTEIEAAKDEFNSKHFDLPLKNAVLIVHTTPPSAEVYIDGEKVGISPTAPKTLTAGRHEVRVVKEGLPSDRREIFLRGGERKVLSDFKLVPRSTAGEPALWKELQGSEPSMRSPRPR